MSAQQELNTVKNELQSIINEMDDIADGISRDFQGIGQERCAKTVRELAEHYRYVKKKLDKVDISKLREVYEAVTGL